MIPAEKNELYHEIFLLLAYMLLLLAALELMTWL